MSAEVKNMTRNRIRDSCYVALHIGAGPTEIEKKSGSTVVVSDGDNRFDLSEDIWIEKLDEQLAKNVQTACEPRHFNISAEPRDRHLYAFLRFVPEPEHLKYQGTEELFATIALSRLIRPTSMGARYCALLFDRGLEDSPIQAIPFRGASPDAFISGGQTDWLSVEDGENLRKLMAWVPNNKPMHKRVHRAYWNHEYAMRSYYLDMRLIFVVSGLEALITVFGKKEEGTGLQFRKRVHKLASELQINLTRDELELAWQLRSAVAHGQDFLHSLTNVTLPKGHHHALYMKLEELLRNTVKRCLFEQNFANYFRDDPAVKAKWS